MESRTRKCDVSNALLLARMVLMPLNNTTIIKSDEDCAALTTFILLENHLEEINSLLLSGHEAFRSVLGTKHELLESIFGSLLSILSNVVVLTDEETLDISPIDLNKLTMLENGAISVDLADVDAEDQVVEAIIYKHLVATHFAAITAYDLLLLASYDVLGYWLGDEDDIHLATNFNSHSFQTIYLGAMGLGCMILDIKRQLASRKAFKREPLIQEVVQACDTILEIELMLHEDKETNDKYAYGNDGWLEKSITAYCQFIFAVDNLLAETDTTTKHRALPVEGLRYMITNAETWITEAEAHKTECNPFPPHEQ